MRNPHFIDLPLQLRALTRTVLILIFLALVDSLVLHSQPSLTFSTPVPASFTLVAPPRQLSETDILIHPQLSPPEKRILREQLGRDYQSVELRPTWPEHAGYALCALFALGCFWFLFSIAGEEWTPQRAHHLHKGKLWAFTALYFSYAVAAAMAWVWLSPWPFVAMGSTLLTFGAVLERIPYSKIPEQPSVQNYLEVRPHPRPPKLKVNPIIRKMFEKRPETDFQEANQAWLRKIREHEIRPTTSL